MKGIDLKDSEKHLKHNLMFRILVCNRCDHCWTTRMEEDPKTCPKCKSPYYKTERRDKQKGGSVKNG